MAKQDPLHDAKIVGSKAVHLASLFVGMFIFWMVLAGRTETKFIVYGIITAAVTSWVTYPLLLVTNKTGDKKYFVFGVNPFKFISYFCWLMWQLVLANIDVLLATTSQELQIDPKIVRFKVHFDNPVACVALADSITVTPGTVTINVTDDGLYEIHALTPGAAEGIYAGDFPKHVADLFGETCDFAMVEEGRK